MELRNAHGNFESKMIFSQVCIQDLQWWYDNISGSSAPISHSQPDIVIESDTSGKGYDFNCKSLQITAWGPWKKGEKLHHINVLELLAVYQIYLFSEEKYSCTVIVR